MSFAPLMKIDTTLLAGLSGLIWGLMGACFSQKVAGAHVWFAAPLGIPIGIAVLRGSRWTYEKTRWVLFSAVIIRTIMAVALFGLCVGLVDLMRDIPNRNGFAVMIQSMLTYLFGLLSMPPFWAFFLLSFANHALLRFLINQTPKISEKSNHAPAVHQ
ncbi:MAG TPA: hypothetical protein DHV39_04135 [Verrucomicrobiales bacterium]|nr:hypothetical protein [Verrucomicrobiales bacterium]